MPTFTAILTAATSSRFRVVIVDDLQGWRRSPALFLADARQASQIAFDVRAQVLREVVPSGAFGRLHRRLDETDVRPTVDPAGSVIPQPCQNSPACHITGACPRSRTGGHLAVHGRLIYLPQFSLHDVG